jgi:murein DD-endopeptidase MepM/ murein hydrolase activator NlpD
MVFKKFSIYTLASAVFILAYVFLPITSIFAETVEELNQQIDSYADKIKQIDKEIEEQRKLIQTTSSKAGEIQTQINILNATRNKLKKDITRTQDVIKKSELTIEKLDIEITDKQRMVNELQEGLAQSMRSLQKTSDSSLLELAFDTNSVSDFFAQVVEIQKFKEKLINKKYELLNINRELGEKKSSEEKTKEELEKEKQILAGQQETVLSTQQTQSSLLSATKSEQSKYEQLLKEKETQRQQFEALVRDIESQIKILIDPNSYPSAQKSILAWPLDNIIVTQQFGGSDFAAKNPGIYGRPYHPGTDFGTPVGTKVKSVSSGTVRDFGNTDAFPGCYAWGKWILIDHDNGLSSLYAHLSSILVDRGQKLSSGEVIALSGNTGITTGPHLHLTIYASQGVKVGKYGVYKPGGAGCAATDASGPFADLDAYLDPMSYLPGL